MKVTSLFIKTKMNWVQDDPFIKMPFIPSATL